jgi:hypothetical protein
VLEVGLEVVLVFATLPSQRETRFDDRALAPLLSSSTDESLAGVTERQAHSVGTLPHADDEDDLRPHDEDGRHTRHRLMARRWQVLLVISVAVFMTFLDVTIVNIAFPDIRASFPDSSLASLSWILNAYAIVFAAAP